MAGPQRDDPKLDPMGPTELVGSAMGVFPLATLKTRYLYRNRSGRKGISAKFEENRDLDTVNSKKFSDPLRGVTYIHGGRINVDEENFNVSKSGDKPQAHNFQIGKDSLTSTGGTTKLGSPHIKSLTGVRLNPRGVQRPSTPFTPEKAWLSSMFPVFSQFDIVDWAFTTAVQAILAVALKELVGKLDEDELIGETSTVQKERKDLGTLIVDNQEFERKILEGDL